MCNIPSGPMPSPGLSQVRPVATNEEIVAGEGLEGLTGQLSTPKRCGSASCRTRLIAATPLAAPSATSPKNPISSLAPASARFVPKASALIGANTRLPAPGALFSAAPGAPATIPCPASLTGLSPPAIASCTRGAVVGPTAAREANIQLGDDPFTGQAFAGLDLRQDIAALTIAWNADWGSLDYRFGFLDNESRLQQDGDYSNFPAGPGFILALSALKDLRF